MAKVSWLNGACLGRWIQALLSLYAFWQVKCRQYVGDSDKDGHNSFMYANPCSVFSTLHAAFERMRIRMCSECYLCCVHNYVCRHTHTLFTAVWP